MASRKHRQPRPEQPPEREQGRERRQREEPQPRAPEPGDDRHAPDDELPHH
jgi:hypothetical protein